MLNNLYARVPSQPGLARCMMLVIQALQQPRDQMELWYGRAMATDPNDFTACQAKEYYLLPRWYGTEQDEWAFGQECVQSNKWSAKIPMILVEELDYRVEAEPDVYANDDVWKTLEMVYREFLSRFPDSIYYRTHFAQDARLGRHWDVAREQLKILGENFSRDIFSDKGYAELKAEVAAH